MSITVRDLAKMIDHSLLHPTMTDQILREGCTVAAAYDCATVCIKPYAVPLAAELLADSEVLVCAVAGFPHGNSHTEIIIAEAVRALGVSRIGATATKPMLDEAKARREAGQELKAPESAAVTGGGY